MVAVLDREGGDITAADMLSPTQDPSEIKKFFAGSTVFITGVTGYLGKLILEKLLRVCTDVRHIYVLVREKKGKDKQKRFEEIFDCPVFDLLRRSHSDFMQKISMFSGDCSLPDLGLNDQDKQILLTEVDCVFHCAATVRFDEHLKLAAMTNVRAVRDLLFIARKMKQLRALVHVSTAYSHCPRKDVEETFYKPKITGDKLISLVDALDEQTLSEITKILLGSWPNSYVFTKAVAEEVIQTYGSGLPIAVVRPSIVIATVKEPVAGWIDNYYGATGILLAVALGLMRSLNGNENHLADVVPADYVINSAIAAAWNVATTKVLRGNQEVRKEASESGENLEKDIEIYNYVSSPQNPLTWRNYTDLSEKCCLQVPSPKVVWYYNFKMRPNKLWHTICIIFLHYIPAYLVDFAFICIGKKPRMIDGYKKIHKFSEVISYFTTREWNFKNTNVQSLWKKMNPVDRELFEFNIGALDWDTYYHTYVRGARLYLLQDPLDTIPQGKSKYMKLKVLHYTLLTFLALAFLKIVEILIRMVFF